MKTSFRNFLYENPALYYEIYPSEDEIRMVKNLVQRYSIDISEGTLDLGCGGGVVLAKSADPNAFNVGVDILPKMLEYARKHFSNIDFQNENMTSFSVSHNFGLILSMGAALQYALTTEDILETLKTIKQHLSPRGKVIIDINNSASYLEGIGGYKAKEHRSIVTPNLDADLFVERQFNLRTQIMTRTRTWHIRMPSPTSFDDFCEYRMLFPEELIFLLKVSGLSCIDMWDNYDLELSDLSNDRLFLLAEHA